MLAEEGRIKTYKNCNCITSSISGTFSSFESHVSVVGDEVKVHTKWRRKVGGIS